MVIGILPAKEGAKYIIYRVMVNWSQGCRTGITRGFWNLHPAIHHELYTGTYVRVMLNSNIK